MDELLACPHQSLRMLLFYLSKPVHGLTLATSSTPWAVSESRDITVGLAISKGNVRVYRGKVKSQISELHPHDAVERLSFQAFYRKWPCQLDIYLSCKSISSPEILL